MDYNGNNPGESGSHGPYQHRPINLDTLKFKKFVKRFGVIILVVIAALIIAFQSLYQLSSGSQAVVTRFGRYVRTEEVPGLKLKVPFIETAYVVNVEGIRRLEFGYRTSGMSNSSLYSPASPSNSNINYSGDGYYSDVPEYQYTDKTSESTMLTRDENIVIAEWAIQYKVTDSHDWLFNVAHPEETLRIISESTYRRVVASHDLDDILTDQKDTMQNEVLVDLQALCNQYGLGVIVTSVELQDAMPPEEVKAAFLDVTAAQEEKAAMINEATRYENEKLPVARGDAQKALNDAEGYRQERINEALGAASRYTSIEEEYAKMPGITKTRMYLEMVKEVFPHLKQVYIMDEASETLKVISLDETATTGPDAASYSSEVR